MAERYSTEQVQQILVQAMEQGEQAGFSRSQLEDMAADLGISVSALAQAEQTCQTLPVSPVQTPQRQRFYQQLKTYAVVNIFLIALNITLEGTVTWAIYPLLGWGLGLLLPSRPSACKTE